MKEGGHIKCRLSLEPIVDRPIQLVGQDGQRFALVMCFLQSCEVCLSSLVVAQKQCGGFGKGPLEVGVPDFFP
jgi:hypothetical protein